MFKRLFFVVLALFVGFNTNVMYAQSQDSTEDDVHVVETRKLSGDITIVKTAKVLLAPELGIKEFLELKDGCQIILEQQDFETAGVIIKLTMKNPEGETLKLKTFSTPSLKLTRQKKTDGNYNYVISDDNFVYTIMLGYDDGYVITIKAMEILLEYPSQGLPVSFKEKSSLSKL